MPLLFGTLQHSDLEFVSNFEFTYHFLMFRHDQNNIGMIPALRNGQNFSDLLSGGRADG